MPDKGPGSKSHGKKPKGGVKPGGKKQKKGQPASDQR